LYNESNLNPDFKTRHKDKLILGSRGFGYWIWKPYIILKSLQEIPEGSILLYMDSGCHLNFYGKKTFYDYIEKVYEKDILCIDTGLPEKNYTKGDVFHFFNVKDNKNITDSHQIAATVIFVKKTATIMSMIKTWLDVMENHFELVDDSPSISENCLEFIENRHDQSIFSILLKLNNVIPLPASALFTKNKDIQNPIWVMRDKKLKLKYRYSLKRFLRKKFQKTHVF
jgi:hypothetical protein